MTVLTWSDERVEQLKKLWESGLSASQIAAELGNITRNAVIGKVHRLGLSGRAQRPYPAGPRPRQEPFLGGAAAAQGAPVTAHGAHLASDVARQHRARPGLRDRAGA